MHIPSEIQERKWLGIRPFQHHSRVLLVAGFAYISIGMTYRFAEPTPERTKALYFALSWWDLDAWGWVFIITGVLAIISSRWPPFSRSWGYVALTSLSSGWAAFYLTGILLHDAPWANFSRVAIWGLMAYLWWAISGLRNPEDL